MEFQSFVNGPFSTNTYLVWELGTENGFIIDPATPCKPLLEEMQHLGIKPSYILLTHGHSDHTGGIAALRELYPDIRLLASKKEHELLASRKLSYSRGGIFADIEVSDGDTLDIGNMHLQFISTPGHTPGGMCILVEDCLFCGDTLFFSSIGRTDLHGGDQDALIASIREKLFVLPDSVKCFPGHGGATTIGFEKENNPFV